MSQVLLRDRVQDDAETLQAKMLWNTGNYFFLDAVQNQVEFDRVTYSDGESVEEDTLVLSMSNFISESTDMGMFADYIEKHNFSRVVMIGAGAQAHDLRSEVTLRPGTDRFLRLISERSTSIGVRGQFTGLVLERLGIENVRVIGCPTLFWSGSRAFAVPRPQEPERFAFNITPNGKYREKLGLLLGAAADAEAQYISQDENFVDAVGEGSEARRAWNARYYGNGDQRVQGLLDAERHFYSIPEWIEYMKQFDFVAGTRFHGNMAALQAGVPALLLACDSRTKELADFLNLPYISFASYRGESLAQLAARTDFELFNATYADKYDNYVLFLEENGLSHRMDRSGVLGSGASSDSPLDVQYRHRADGQFLQDTRRNGVPVGTAARVLDDRREPLRSAAVGLAAEKGAFSAQESAGLGGEMEALLHLLPEGEGAIESVQS